MINKQTKNLGFTVYGPISIIPSPWSNLATLPFPQEGQEVRDQGVWRWLRLKGTGSGCAFLRTHTTPQGLLVFRIWLEPLGQIPSYLRPFRFKCNKCSLSGTHHVSGNVLNMLQTELRRFPPPQIHMLKPKTPKVAVFGDRASKEVNKIKWGHKSGALI